jgi:hypothetical protein
LAILIILMFLLGQAMVNHRFFQGGGVNQRDVLKPQQRQGSVIRYAGEDSGTSEAAIRMRHKTCQVNT